jgi:hypothetical protein
MPPKTKRGMWTDEMPEVVIYLVKRRTHSLRKVSKSWDMSSIIDHLNRKTRSKKMGSKGVLIEEKKCYNDEVDLRHARMWIVHKPRTIKDEGYKANTNKGYTISKWNTRQ